MRHLLAFTGTLRTMPREINVGYVIAMPKFTRMLKAVERKHITNMLRIENVKENSWFCMKISYLSYTKKQCCDSTEVGPGDICRRASVLHMSKIQDYWHKTDENKVGASDNAQEECSLSKFGTTQDHLEEHLRIHKRGNVFGKKTPKNSPTL